MTTTTPPLGCPSCGLTPRSSPMLRDACSSGLARDEVVPLPEVSANGVHLATDGELGRQLLREAGFMTAGQKLKEALSVVLAMAAETDVVWEVLEAHGFLNDSRDLAQGVQEAVAWTEDFPGGLRELRQFQDQYVKFAEGYFRERQWRVNVARIASHVILRAHRESHTGKVVDCPTCSGDWATVQDASGVTAPDC